MKSVFVTGGTGFIGKHLIQRLVAGGAACHCLVRETSDTRSLPKSGVALVYGSVDRPETYADAIAKCDTVIHLAGLTHAITTDELFRINADACGRLADACIDSSVQKIIYVSSLAAAGPPPKPKLVRDESDADEPVSDYGRSKLAGEMEFRKRAEKLSTTVIRPAVVYGPGDQKIAQLISSVVQWRLHLVVGFRTPKLSLIHVDDLVSLILAAARDGERLEADSSDPAIGSRGVYFACDDAEFVTYWRVRAADRQGGQHPRSRLANLEINWICDRLDL